jgi:hypothetical protein
MLDALLYGMPRTNGHMICGYEYFCQELAYFRGYLVRLGLAWASNHVHFLRQEVQRSRFCGRVLGDAKDERSARERAGLLIIGLARIGKTPIYDGLRHQCFTSFYVKRLQVNNWCNILFSCGLIPIQPPPASKKR